MNEPVLDAIRDIIQEDVGGRGLRTDPSANLINACPDDFALACRSLAEAPAAGVAIVTGFYIPQGQPPAGETDGPLGAVFLARVFTQLGMNVALMTDAFCSQSLDVGLGYWNLQQQVRVLTLPSSRVGWSGFVESNWESLAKAPFFMTHLIALERVGPSHTRESVLQQPGSTSVSVAQFETEVPPEARARCYSMRGRDISEFMSPAHLLFEDCLPPGLVTIGIGDGGNEIGMGKIPWDIIRRNIPRGGLVACRTRVDHLVVSGVSNWGAYGLAAGVLHLRGQPLHSDLFDLGRELETLQLMVERGPLVDGVTGKQTATVDGFDFDRYAEPLSRISTLVP
jgi:hypothetical protein